MPLQQIIVIDDNDVDRLCARLVLEGAGVADSVLAFGNGADALDFLQRPEGHDVDLILLDIHMPGMDGFAFLQAYERVHASQRARAMVVMLSASTDDADRARAAGFGCVRRQLVKPLGLAQARELADLLQALPEAQH
jgi:CheY-like chemotaxis protein